MKLILCGGGSGEQNALTNRKFNEITDHSKPLLYVPLALDETKHPYYGCLEWIRGELSEADFPSIEMVRTFEEFASEDYERYSAIFIGGGNTYKLLKGIKDSGAFEKIKAYLANGGVVFGGSAGAVIFGEDIEVVAPMDTNNVGLADTRGFDVMHGISVCPHYINPRTSLTPEENEERARRITDAVKKFSVGRKVIAIPEEDSIYYDGENIEIVGTGAYHTFIDGKVEKHDAAGHG